MRAVRDGLVNSSARHQSCWFDAEIAPYQVETLFPRLLDGIGHPTVANAVIELPTLAPPVDYRRLAGLSQG